MKRKNITIFSIALALLCVALRTATLLYTTEEGTGFFIHRLAPLGKILCATIFLIAAVSFVFSFFIEEKPYSSFKPSFFSGIASISLGIAVIATSFGFGAHIYTVKWQHTLEMLSGILAGLWFIIFGATAFNNYKLPAITSIFPCIYSILRLVVVFTSISTSSLVSEHIFTLFYHISVMLYMLNFGRLVANVPSKSTVKAFFPVTILTFIFTVTSVFSRLVLMFLGKTEMIHGEVALDISGIVLSVFILFITKDIYKENNIQEPYEEDDNQSDGMIYY